jgi:hypothetical protein
MQTVNRRRVESTSFSNIEKSTNDATFEFRMRCAQFPHKVAVNRTSQNVLLVKPGLDHQS